MSDPSEFGTLMDRVAVPGQQLLVSPGLPGPHAVRVAVRRRLHDRLRPHYDSLDFVQEVWASFLALDPGRYRFADPDALVGFLCRVARNKVVEVFRKRFATTKHDITREVPYPPEGEDSRNGVPGPGPTPSQAAMAGERWADLVRRLPEGHRVVLERLREGHTHEEVAALLSINVRTVERIVRRLKDLCG